MVESGARKHGFSSPTNFFQVLSWVLYACFLASFYALVFLFPGTVGRAVAGAVFGIAALATGAAAAGSTAIDPADPSIYAEPAHDSRAVVPGHLYCYRCQRHVSEQSKHCVVCRKCVHRFDHHCVWLNNCVGTRNYRIFFLLLVSAAAMLGCELGLCVYNIALFGINQNDFDARVRSFYPNLSGGAYFGLNVAFTVLLLTVWLLVLQLLAFHCFLVSKGLTTYDYIFQRQRQEFERRGRFPTAPQADSEAKTADADTNAAMARLEAPPTAVRPAGTASPGTSTTHTRIGNRRVGSGSAAIAAEAATAGGANFAGTHVVSAASGGTTVLDGTGWTGAPLVVNEAPRPPEGVVAVLSDSVAADLQLCALPSAGSADQLAAAGEVAIEVSSPGSTARMPVPDAAALATGGALVAAPSSAEQPGDTLDVHSVGGDVDVAVHSTDTAKPGIASAGNSVSCLDAEPADGNEMRNSLAVIIPS